MLRCGAMRLRKKSQNQLREGLKKSERQLDVKAKLYIQKPIWFWCFTIPFESSLKRCNPLATQTNFLVETLAQVTGQPEGYAIYVGHWIEDWNAVSQPKMISRSHLFQSIATQPKLYRIMVHQIKGRTIEIKLYIAYFSLFLMRPCSYILHCHIIARKLPFDFQKR